MKNSVALTTYNGEKYIIEQLDSIRTQTLPPDEVVICDDGSKDDTPKMIENYIELHKLKNWKFIVNKTNKGFFDNFIEAIRDCSGDIIYLADQDDVWDLNKVKKFTKLYETDEDIMMVQSNPRFIDADGKNLQSKELYHGKRPSEKPIELTTEDMFRFSGSGYTMSFRRCVSDKVFKMEFDKMKEVFRFHDLLLGHMASIMGKCYLMTDVVDAHRLHSSNETQQSGKSYLAGRTKEVQIEILERRKKQCKLMGNLCRDKQKQIFTSKFSEFTEHRIDLIKYHRTKCIPFLVKHIDYYASKKGIVTDILYAAGLEGFLLKAYKKS